MNNEVGNTIVKWLYTDKADIKHDEKFIIELVKTANKYRLNPLKERSASLFACHEMLICTALESSELISSLERVLDK